MLKYNNCTFIVENICNGQKLFYVSSFYNLQTISSLSFMYNAEYSAINAVRDINTKFIIYRNNFKII